jgi:hypothetical protein
MADTPDGPPVVELPERFDRRLRLGPFASARDALKFVTYAAVGALLAPFTLPYLWLPVVAAGFVLSVWKPDGQAADERGLDYLAWKMRGRFHGGSLTAPMFPADLRGGFLRIGPGRFVAIVRAEGAPFAYLPPAELGRRFELFRALLRGADTSLSLLVTAEPIQSSAVAPAWEPLGVDERGARTGYGELVGLICRRRSQRRVYVALATTDTGPDAVSRLDQRAEALRGRLAGLGLRPLRLSGRALRDAGRRYGWSPRREAS